MESQHMRVKFYSDANLDGFVQSIARLHLEMDVNMQTSEVTLDDDYRVRDTVSQWGGEVVEN